MTNVDGRGVYSFCMCPGGVVVPACTGPEQQVVNGMSASGRNTAWANSAMVTSIGEAELVGMNYNGLFAGMEFQEDLERMAWEEGGKNLYAPAQRLTHFLRGHLSENLPRTSYKPGVRATLFGEWLPEVVYPAPLHGIGSIREEGERGHHGRGGFTGSGEQDFFAVEDSPGGGKYGSSGSCGVISMR